MSEAIPATLEQPGTASALVVELFCFLGLECMVTLKLSTAVSHKEFKVNVAYFFGCCSGLETSNVSSFDISSQNSSSIVPVKVSFLSSLYLKKLPISISSERALI